MMCSTGGCMSVVVRVQCILYACILVFVTEHQPLLIDCAITK